MILSDTANKRRKTYNEFNCRREHCVSTIKDESTLHDSRKGKKKKISADLKQLNSRAAE